MVYTFYLLRFKLYLQVVSTACELKEFNMYKCTIPEVRHVKCKDMKVTCITPFTSANGGDYAHMLELFMVVDFPNGKFGQHLFKNKGIFF